MLARLEFGECEYSAPRIDGGELRVTARRVLAGRPIDEVDEIPTGSALLAAAGSLILGGKLKSPAGERLRADIEAWNLYLALGEREGDKADPERWLEHRLASLGIETFADLDLVEPEDLIFPGIPEWERLRFDERFPRRLDLPELTLTVYYDGARRRVTVERVGGRRKDPPKRMELPAAWHGWTIRFKDRSRVVEVKR